MIVVVLTLLFCLTLGGVVLVHVAFVQRGRPVPWVPWVGVAIERVTRRLPACDDDERPLTEEESRSGRMSP